MQNSYDEQQQKRGKGPSILVIFGALLLLGLAYVLLMPGNLTPRRKANEAAAIETMRLIHSVQATYHERVSKGQFGTAEELFKADFIDPVVASALGVPAG